MVSIIITTKNEEKNIENCIKSVLNQDFHSENIEILIIDNNSSDKTREIAKRYVNPNQVYNLIDYIDLSKVKNFRGAQLNLGVEKAKGDIIFFPDADMTFDKELFLDAVRKLNDLDALFIPEVVCGKGFFGKIRNFERSFYNETCIDGVRFVKREVFLRVGGFDVKNILFGPDDWDFTKTLTKNNIKLGITGKSLFHHEEWMTVGVYVWKKGKYVNTFEGYVKKWGKNDKDIRKQLGISYRYFNVFIENGKWKKIIKHPLLSLGMFGLKFLVGFIYLLKR